MKPHHGHDIKLSFVRHLLSYCMAVFVALALNTMRFARDKYESLKESAFPSLVVQIPNDKKCRCCPQLSVAFFSRSTATDGIEFQF